MLRINNQMDLPQGHFLVLLFTFPSGTNYVAGSKDGELTFIPIDDSGQVKDVMAWYSFDSLEKWLEQFVKQNGKKKFKNLQSLNMRVGQMQMIQ